MADIYVYDKLTNRSYDLLLDPEYGCGRLEFSIAGVIRALILPFPSVADVISSPHVLLSDGELHISRVYSSQKYVKQDASYLLTYTGKHGVGYALHFNRPGSRNNHNVIYITDKEES